VPRRPLLRKAFGYNSHDSRKSFAFYRVVFQALDMTSPLALVWYEKLLPGSQLVNRLQDLGYRVQTAPDPGVLTTCAEQEKPMIVLVDVVGSKAKVLDAVGRLKKNAATSHLPVIAFADDKDEAAHTAARSAGATLVVKEGALLEHLEQFLQQALQFE
jgi:CheY-like chemotaxis protein